MALVQRKENTIGAAGEEVQGNKQHVRLNVEKRKERVVHLSGWQNHHFLSGILA
jgi:hypothetical protein